MMESTTRKASRHEYLASLNTSIKSCSTALEDFMNVIGWTEPPDRTKILQISKTTEKASQENNINEYSEEPPLPSFSSSISQKFTINIDSEKQRNLFTNRINAIPDLRQPPASVGELTANFTLEERRILYEYTLKNATPVATPPELIPLESETSESQPKELSGLELKKAMRDFKRRRQAYRTKVSTKNKTQTEVTREIIHNMMGLLGMEEPESDTVAIPNKQHPSPSYSLRDNSDLTLSDRRGESITSPPKVIPNTFPERDIIYTKHQEKRHKRSEPDYHNRSRSPRESGKYDRKNMNHDTSRFLSKDEKKHRKSEKDSRGRTPDKYHSKYKDQNRDHKREKYVDELEYREHEHRKLKMNYKDHYENETRPVRYESFMHKSHKREKEERKKRRDEY